MEHSREQVIGQRRAGAEEGVNSGHQQEAQRAEPRKVTKVQRRQRAGLHDIPGVQEGDGVVAVEILREGVDKRQCTQREQENDLCRRTLENSGGTRARVARGVWTRSFLCQRACHLTLPGQL